MSGLFDIEVYLLSTMVVVGELLMHLFVDRRLE